jgi:hypothetical protein
LANAIAGATPPIVRLPSMGGPPRGSPGGSPAPADTAGAQPSKAGPTGQRILGGRENEAGRAADDRSGPHRYSATAPDSSQEAPSSAADGADGKENGENPPETAASRGAESVPIDAAAWAGAVCGPRPDGIGSDQASEGQPTGEAGSVDGSRVSECDAEAWPPAMLGPAAKAAGSAQASEGQLAGETGNVDGSGVSESDAEVQAGRFFGLGADQAGEDRLADEGVAPRREDPPASDNREARLRPAQTHGEVDGQQTRWAADGAAADVRAGGQAGQARTGQTVGLGEEQGRLVASILNGAAQPHAGGPSEELGRVGRSGPADQQADGAASATQPHAAQTVQAVRPAAVPSAVIQAAYGSQEVQATSAAPFR